MCRQHSHDRLEEKGLSSMTELMSLAQQFPYIGLFMLLVLGSVGLPVPEEATLLLGGYLIAQGTVAPIPGLLFLYAGLIASDFIIYAVGRRFGRRLLTHPRIQKMLPEAARQRIEDKFGKFGMLFLLFGRHIIGFRSQLFFVAGTMGFPARKFLAIDSVAALISLSIVVTLGYSGTSLIDLIGNAAGWTPYQAGQVGFAVCIIIVSTVIVTRRMISRRNASCRVADGNDY